MKKEDKLKTWYVTGLHLSKVEMVANEMTVSQEVIISIYIYTSIYLYLYLSIYLSIDTQIFTIEQLLQTLKKLDGWM